jgi:stress response protein YsnF
MSMMNHRTVTALFNNRHEASQAVEELVKVGVSRASIRVTPESDVSSREVKSSYDVNRDEKGFWASLADLFMPDEDRYTYAEALHRGSIMVSASVTGAQADSVETILERYGTVNMDDQAEAWRKEGWTGYTGGTAQQGTHSSQAIPEVEERLRVGKRQVNSGRVKVRSYVVERPVSEAVNLHSETVKVERRPVDRPLDATEEAFRERTVEAQSTSEEAVVTKEARVTGEVLVRKEGSDRTETVKDKVRSTKVEVEDGRRSDSRPTPRGR